jgi:hypothetical protein
VRMLSRALVLVAVCVALSLPGWTDAVAGTSWELGIKAGVSAAKLSGDDTKMEETIDADNYYKSDISDMKVGFVGGGYATMHMNKQFGLRLEALYFQKGGKGTAEGADGGFAYTADETYTIDYFELPLLAVFSIPAGTSGTFDIFAGAAFAFNVTAKQKSEWTGEGESGTDEGDLEDIKSSDIGGVLGLGYTFAMDSMNLFADARWEMGFSSIVDVEDVDVKNNAFAFMIGVAFPLGGSATATPAP